LNYLIQFFVANLWWSRLFPEKMGMNIFAKSMETLAKYMEIHVMQFSGFFVKMLEFVLKICKINWKF